MAKAMIAQEQESGSVADDSFLGPMVKVVQTPFDGAAEAIEEPMLYALDRLGWNPENGVVWYSAHIYPYEEDVGRWDRTP